MLRKTLLSLSGLIWASAANADWALNMPRGITELSAETYDLHMMVFWWCVAIGIVVFGVMIISLFKHRKSRGAKPATFSHSTSAEVIWTIIPCIILLVMSVPAAETMIRLEDSRDPDISIVVTGYQWKWHYKYQDEGVEFYSSLALPSVKARFKDSGLDPFGVDHYLLDVDRPLVVPKGKKVRLLLTASDVMALETGTFRGQCAELCGKDHGYMPIVIEVVEPDAYQAWVDARQNDSARLAQVEN